MAFVSLSRVSRWIPTLLLLAPIALAACSSTGKDEKNLPPQKTAQELFDTGTRDLEKERYVGAVKSFQELEKLYPYADLAPKAKILSAYANYMKEDYDEAIVGLDQFLQMHPGSKDAPYALYLKALCYYEQISDVSRDQSMTRKAMEQLALVTSRYPDTSYAKEAKMKLDLTRDHLAGKEMDIGRWYQKNNQMQAAINRYRTVVDTYQTTNHTPEALHRMVECYLSLGLVKEARETAVVLGHNYPGSTWYQDTYALIGNDPSAKPVGDDSGEKSWFSRTVGSMF